MNAYYIKLGRGGAWEKVSLEQNCMRIGWELDSLADINAQNWAVIEERSRNYHKNRGTATKDVNALRWIVESTEDDLWITFSSSRLYWCHLESGPVEEDDISKFRRVRGKWRDCDERGKPLLTAEIPGSISSLQGFRGTVCRVREVKRLVDLLAGETSPTHRRLAEARQALVRETAATLSELHWKDFETLVDLLFRQAGWRRLSMLGGTMKFADLELQEPINKEKYQVQIKSTATTQDFEQYRADFSRKEFRKFFFVVHTPEGDWTKVNHTDEVELVLPQRLAEMTVDAGLVDWLLAKTR